ncbi:MAG TPA: neutral zinc metallopeptidase [Saprospiraceae bacterium]|jgi:predicted metalloprotease|nr:zinc metallopeptidase [Saprospiraceae bacterium]HRO09732.1 neutral zinc metallopeptidase [Saprospiraceae bacterium]HRP42976.1 neutral zinc metallopeptidase [Saprospiraceae bacterium]
MKWEGRRQSDNLEDRRGMSTTGKVAVGGGAIGLIFLLFQLFMGGDSQDIANALAQQMQATQSQTTSRELSPQEKLVGEFVSTILASTEDTWHEVFRKNNMTYKEPKMVLFTDATNSGCGGANASTGPFYCPADQTVYMDLAFLNVLRNRFGAKGGDFAIAYIIAHEVGHHVQNLLGILQQTHNLQRQTSQVQGNQIQVATELQADYLAGVWAHYEQKYIEPGDVEDAMNAAASVGDDHIQKSTQGYTQPETYTHGTSKQRVEWFNRGYKSGDISQGDTFGELLR